jgi:ribose/xylose/arabinose/galactoside ABC-type transport system permease subunit
VLGFALALVVVGFHVPAWAATLGVAVLIGAVSVGVVGTDLARLEDNPPDVLDTARLWAVLFVVASVVGGLLWLAPGVRRGLGGARQERDPARRPPVSAVFGGLMALVVSSTLASGAGVLSVLRLGGAPPRSLDELTFVALGAVLIGGVSAFGRRAGVFGTVLGVLLLSLIQRWIQLESVDGWVFSAVVGGAILVGLIVNRLLEAAGRKRARYDSVPGGRD